MQELRQRSHQMKFTNITEEGKLFWVPSCNPSIKLQSWEVQSFVDKMTGYIRNYEKERYDEF